MPGYADWRKLFLEEYVQLNDEGYDLTDAPKLSEDKSTLANGETGDEAWKRAYDELWALTKHPLRPDYPYVEPNGFEEILAAAAERPELIPTDEAEYTRRIKGAVLGRIAGVILGKPLESNYNAQTVRQYLIGANAYPLNDWVPAASEGTGMRARGDCWPSTKGHIAYAQPDDDINYTLLALRLAERKGLDFSAADVGYNWLDNVPYHWFWCASRQAYYHLVRGDRVEDIPTSLNPWRECIDGQIRCDLWGYVAPADLDKAALGAYRDCAFSLTKNGIYGGMFVAGCLAGALAENPTVDRILDSGLAVIPKQSRLAEAVTLVREWYRATPDFDVVCGKIYEKYGYLSYAMTVNNLSMVVLSLLHGNLDYEKTITSAVMAGMDTDCNGGTAGSIVGAAVGIDGIEERWYAPLNDTIKSNVAAFGQVTISSVIDRILALRKKLAQ